MDEATARAEARAIVVSFMWFPCRGKDNTERGCIESGRPQQAGRGEWGRPWGRAVGGTGTNLMWVCDPPPPINSALLTPTSSAGREAHEDDRGYSDDTSGTVNWRPRGSGIGSSNGWDRDAQHDA